MREGIAELISQTYVSDSIGNRVAAETMRSVFVTEQSVTRAEWSAAGQRGLNPSVVLKTPSVNYNGEKIIEYDGQRYGVYRTYEKDSEVELYLERKAGE